MRRESAEARLARLRRRLTAALAAVSLVGIAGLAGVTTIVDGQLRSDRSDTELQGQAFRAAALVFFDTDTDDWNVAGVTDDVVAQSAAGILIVDGQSGTELLATSEIRNAEGLVADVLADGAEEGSLATVLVDGREVRAAGAPYFGIAGEGDITVDGVAGAVLVAADRSADPDRSRLVAFVWSAAALLVALSAVLSWVMAGRVVRPLGAELDREEAFLATAAHELRTPLGRFQAVTESTMLSARGLPESVERSEVASGLHRLLQLNGDMTKSVEDLLLLGRIEAGVVAARREVIALDQLVGAFEATTMELAVDTDGLVEIIGDPTLIHHAVSNLLVNSQEHGRTPSRPLLIEAAVSVVDGMAVVAVSDNGPGMSGDLESIFERDVSRRENGGLGLWIVRTIANDHGGSVTARNGTDGGAVFELRLPLR